MLFEKTIKDIDVTDASLETYRSNIVDYQFVSLAIMECIKKKKAFSLVRLGDGENCILAYPEYVAKEQYDWVIRRALGNRDYSSTDFFDMRKQLETSIRSADIIGIYPVENPNPLLGTTIPLMDRRDCYRGQSLSRAWVNYEMQEYASFFEILSNQKIGIISCRDVSQSLELEFNLKVKHFYSIAEEYQYSNRSSNETVKATEPHYPNRFKEVCEAIEVDFPGQIYLVGAGHLGKYYCHLIKERGGIALDIGSIFDTWAGLYTRTCHGDTKKKELLPKWRLKSIEKTEPCYRLVSRLKKIIKSSYGS